jgi:hypothetical protein
MKIYYQMEDTIIDSDDAELANSIGNHADKIHILMLEKLKYHIMWSLRSLETEINDSGGCIIINSGDLKTEISIQCKGFDSNLIEKINLVTAGIKF